MKQPPPARLINLAAFSANALICGMFLVAQNMPGVIINVAIAFFQLGVWFQTAMRAKSDAHALDLIESQSKLLDRQHELLKRHNIIP